MKPFSDEHQRTLKLQNYQIFPWLSLLVLVAAIVLTVIYRPPLVGSIVVIAGTLIGGMGFAYGPVSRHRWMERYGCAMVFITPLLTSNAYHLKVPDGRFFTLIAWMAFGMLAPFWIWRKRGLEMYAPRVPSEAR